MKYYRANRETKTRMKTIRSVATARTVTTRDKPSVDWLTALWHLVDETR